MILEEIAARTRSRVKEKKEQLSISILKQKVMELPRASEYPFEKALSGPELSFICEIKKASPSAGVIAGQFPYVDIAREYEAAGAAAISVLTEPYYFLGSDEYLREIRRAVSLPLLRKDFTVDEYMIYEAKLMGADAVLLICTLLSREQLREYLQIAGELGLSALVEAHDGQEVSAALEAGADIIGINNRNLRDFTVDIGNSIRLRAMVPKDKIFVSESGMRTAEDIKRLRENGTDAVLIGEAFMRSGDKRAVLKSLSS